MTSDKPQANQLAPLIFKPVRMASVTSPNTMDVFTPPFSNTLPLAITRVFPPPPSGRCQASSINFALPSAASSAAQMRFCKSCIYSIQLSFIDISKNQKGKVLNICPFIYSFNLLYTPSQLPQKPWHDPPAHWV